jgi:hypothetical protein
MDKGFINDIYYVVSKEIPAKKGKKGIATSLF